MKAVIFFQFLNVLFSLGTLLVAMVIICEMRKHGEGGGGASKAAVFAKHIGDGVGRLLLKVAPFALPL